MHLRELVLFSTTLIAIVNPISSAVLFASMAGPIARRLGPIGLNVVTRVMGILVSATAFGLLARGLTGLMPGLAR